MSKSVTDLEKEWRKWMKARAKGLVKGNFPYAEELLEHRKPRRLFCLGGRNERTLTGCGDIVGFTHRKRFPGHQKDASRSACQACALSLRYGQKVRQS